MAKYLFAYKGGSVPGSDAEREAVMAAWGAWFGQLGGAVVDMGAPVGASSTVSSGGVSDGGASQLTGFSVLQADSLGAANELAQGCPHLKSGGSIEIYEAHEM